MIARRIASGALLIALSSVAACNGRDASADTSNVNEGVMVGAENVAVVQSQEIRTGPALSGTIEPERSATLRAEVSAAVIETFVEPGQRVAAGTLLARLDDAGIRDQALSGRAAVATAKNADEIAKKELERAEALEKAGAIALRDLERARNAALAAQTQLASAQAMAASAEKQFAKTRIVAPYAGVVSARQVNAGDFVSPGGALFTVVDPTTMRLEAALPAEALASMKIGLPVEFTVSGYADRRFIGQVSRVNPTADPATRQVRILATIPNAGQSLVGGMFAEGRVATESHKAAVVPVLAVDERGVRPSVMRVKNGRVERVEVELGLRDDHTETVEVKSGIAPGDTLLLGTARGLTPGTAVRVSTPSDTKK